MDREIEIRARVEVIQADRDAAGDYAQSVEGEPILAFNLRNGRCDDGPRVQAFARHRLAFAATSAGAGDGEVIDGLKGAWAWIEQLPQGDTAQEHLNAIDAAIAALSASPLTSREEIARTLYEHWVAEVELQGGEMAPWERLGDKETWLSRADAVLALSTPPADA